MAIPKEVWILPALWREIIKPCLFHNIKTQGKHLKNNTYIKYQEYLDIKYSDEGVHLNEAGYSNWANFINDEIASLK